MVNVRNIVSESSGCAVRNQFIISTEEARYFQSYQTIIVRIPFDGGKIQLDRIKWDYSSTTSRYRNQFLGEKKRETEKKIKSGEYELINLNEI